jgi:hypothetical protein
MAKISETELQRKLRNAKTSSGTTGGRTAVQKDGVWEYTSPVIYTAYADNITNRSTTGKIPSQADAAGFQLEPHDAGGELLDWRGHLFSTSIYESGDPTDYTWELADYTGVTTSFERSYTTSTKLLVDVGNPTFPGTGITWTSIASNLALPDNAYFVAERYTIKGATSAWMVYPVAVEENGFGLIPYTITGRDAPALNSAQWNTDTLTAVTSFTGRTYSTIKEFGYGTTIVITYDDGKLYGLLKKVSGTASFVAPVDYIDGALLVDTSIIADKIANNAITVNKILNDSINADKIADNAVTTAAIISNAINSDKIANNAVTSNEIAANTIVANNIQANAIGANEIAADAITANEIATDAVTANAIQAGSVGANEIAANSITAGEIAADAITASEIAVDAVEASSIKAGAVTTNKIEALAITAETIAANAIISDKIATNAITSGKLLITGTGNVSEVITPAYIGAPTTAALATVIGDVATAQSTADGKINSYFQDAAPTSLTASDEGDLWTDTLAANNNESYRWSGTAWEAIADGGIADAIASAAAAQSTADGKVTTFYHDDPPTAEGEGDLWVDTNDSNKLHRWNGSAWLDIHDTTYSSIGSITGGISASQVANAVNTNSTTVDGGKITAASIGASHLIVSGANAVELDGLKTFRQTTSPTAENEGDLWYDSDDHNKLYRWDGSTWVSNQDNTVADNIYSSGTTYINGGIITTDTISGNHIQAGEIDAGHLSVDSVTVDKINVDGQLDISESTGSFTFKKTKYSDYSTNGVFLGNRTGSNIPVFLAGSTTSYIQVDDGGVTIVGADFADSTTISTPALPNVPTEYNTSGQFTFPISSAYDTLTFELSGAGGGGGGARAGGGSTSGGVTGGQTKVEILDGNGAVVSGATWTANGGSGGGHNTTVASTRYGDDFDVSPVDTFFTGDGGTGTPSNPSSGTSHTGSVGGAVSSGGEGGADGASWSDFDDDRFGVGGSAGSFSSPSAYTLQSSHHSVRVTVGTGGNGGSGAASGGRGAHGAVRISVTLH